MSIDTKLNRIKTILGLEEKLGRINSLTDLADSQRHRQTIKELWQAIQADLAPISQAIKDLPQLPDIKTVQWAQSVLAMRDLRFLEIDTTGLEDRDEVIRFTTMNSDEQVLEDFLIKPTESPVSEQASSVNGITAEMLEAQGTGMAEAWERMQAALSGMFVLSYSQEWDIKQLDAMAAKHHLEPITIIGEDLQRRCTRYYNGEYYLNLSNLAARVGYAMPEPPAQTAIHRATAQVRVLVAIANAVTDVRAPASTETNPASVDDTSLGDLGDHPF